MNYWLSYVDWTGYGIVGVSCCFQRISDLEFVVDRRQLFRYCIIIIIMNLGAQICVVPGNALPPHHRVSHVSPNSDHQV